MRETEFIAQNEAKWRTFESQLLSKNLDPGDLSNIYLQITDDLSFARTFYPNRSITFYLNGLAKQAFNRLYGGKRIGRNSLFQFWKKDLPILLYQSRRDLLLAALVFLLSLAIGIVSCALDPDFAKVILGDDYVRMTEANISSGDPMAVYKAKGALGMSLNITANNLRVAFLTFSLGAVFIIGTIAILIRNGVMVGCFQWFFVERGLFWDSFSTIWVHGTLEISAIVLAGAAGITMGRGLVFPGTLPRRKAFQQSAVRGIKIMLGITPVIILAGFIEGFFTRLTDIPMPIRLLFIFLCAAFVFFYYVWYPYRVASRHKTSIYRAIPLPADEELTIPLYSVRDTSLRFKDTLQWMFSKPSWLFRRIGGSALIAVLLLLLISRGNIVSLISIPTNFIQSLGLASFLFDNTSNSWTLSIINMIVIAGVMTSLLFMLQKRPFAWKKYIKVWGIHLLLAVPIVLLLGINNFLSMAAFFLLIPPLMLIIAHSSLPTDEAGHTFRISTILGGRWGHIYGLSAWIIGLSILIMLLLSSTITWLLLDMLTWIIPGDQQTLNNYAHAILLWIVYTLILFMLSTLYVGMFFVGYSLREILAAEALRAKISKITLQPTIRGLQRER